MLATPESWGSTSARERAAVEILERLAMACQREELLSCSLEGTELTLRGKGSSQLSLQLRRVCTMDRFDLADFPASLKSVGPDGCFEWFLDQLLCPPADRREILLAELNNSYLNMALSLESLQERGPGQPGEGDLADWEGRVWYGHPLHPGARLRSGLSPEDNRRYGPEWGARLELPLLSVPTNSLIQVGDFTERLTALFPSLRLDTETERVLVPVHPWQAQNDLKTRFRERFDSGELRFSDKTIPARPTMSFRTVILLTEVGEDYHLKLPVAVQTTGATRTVSVAATQNGPKMSHFLGRLFSHPEMTESDLFDQLHLMAEPASFHINDPDPDKCRFLSAVLRKGPDEGKSFGGRWLLPAAALLEPRDKPLFLSAAEYYGLDPLTLFNRYCRCLIPAQAFLCGELGIALEAHPQNIVVDFRGRRGSTPDVHFWYRDLGGIRMHPGRLAEALKKRGWEDRLEAPSFWPGSATSTGSIRDLSSKFVYSLLQNHLGELIRSVTRAGYSEDDFWGVVHGVLDEHRQLLGRDLEERVFQPHWDLKAMWTMRLDSAITEYTFCPVENPLLRGRKTCPA